jgi:PAS domain S-box-containing protein
MHEQRLTIAAIDDDPGDAELLRRRLEQLPAPLAAFHHFTTVAAAQAAPAWRDADVIFLDYHLGRTSGLEVVRTLRAAGEMRPVIVLSGRGDGAIAAELVRSGADDFLDKSRLNDETLRRAMHNAQAQCARRRVESRNEALIAELRESNALVARRNADLSAATAAAEAAWREIEALHSTINKHSIFSVADARGRIIAANDVFCAISKYRREELLGQDHRLINSGTHPKAFWAQMWKTIAGGAAWRGEVCNRAKDGSLYWVDSIIAPFMGPDGRIERYVSIRNDITARKLAEDRVAASATLIERQNADLAAMAERAHRVVDDVSHEFRTPLAVIKEFASIITDGLAGPVSEKQAEYLKIMDGAVIDLNHMVEDLLDSSKLRAGRLRVDRRAHRVKAIFALGQAGLARKASSRSITIQERIEPGLPAIFADEEKVRRVISNLMTNAIKFSPEGGTIELSASRSTRAGEVVIAVTDHGPGLSTEDVDRLFGRFQQVSTSRAVAAKGFGLGLSIAQELSWLNLGKLSVVSEKGKGATFSFTLPADDIAAVLAHYFEAIAASDRPDDELALLRVVVDAAASAVDELTEPPDADEPGAFLASVTYPTDLVIPSLSDVSEKWEGAAPRSWWVIGRSRSPAAWAQRICEARRTQLLDVAFKLAPLRADVHTTWRYPNEAETARAEVIELVTRANPHGAEHPDRRRRMDDSAGLAGPAERAGFQRAGGG